MRWQSPYPVSRSLAVLGAATRRFIRIIKTAYFLGFFVLVLGFEYLSEVEYGGVDALCAAIGGHDVQAPILVWNDVEPKFCAFGVAAESAIAGSGLNALLFTLILAALWLVYTIFRRHSARDGHLPYRASSPAPTRLSLLMPVLCLGLGCAASAALIAWLTDAHEGLRLRNACLPGGVSALAATAPTADVLCDLDWRDIAGAIWPPGLGLAVAIAGLWNTLAVLTRFLVFVANDRR